MVPKKIFSKNDIFLRDRNIDFFQKKPSCLFHEQNGRFREFYGNLVFFSTTCTFSVILLRSSSTPRSWLRTDTPCIVRLGNEKTHKEEAGNMANMDPVQYLEDEAHRWKSFGPTSFDMGLLVRRSPPSSTSVTCRLCPRSSKSSPPSTSSVRRRNGATPSPSRHRPDGGGDHDQPTRVRGRARANAQVDPGHGHAHQAKDARSAPSAWPSTIRSSSSRPKSCLGNR